MNETALLDVFRSKVSREVDLESEGLQRYIIYTPFMFDDGDHYVVILRNENGQWMLSDEGHTLMHLSYSGVDLSTPTRARIIEESLANHGVERVHGELRLVVPGEDFGNALFSFVQALTRMATVAQMTQARVASAFMEDFTSLLDQIVPAPCMELDWHDLARDPDRNYVVDCKVNSQAVPWFVFAVNSNDRCRNATITCLMYERWGYQFRRLVLFEDQQEINRKALAQLTDVVDKQFSSLGDRNRIETYFSTEVLQ